VVKKKSAGAGTALRTVECVALNPEALKRTPARRSAGGR
jgi:hypothetical protein